MLLIKLYQLDRLLGAISIGAGMSGGRNGVVSCACASETFVVVDSLCGDAAWVGLGGIDMVFCLFSR